LLLDSQASGNRIVQLAGNMRDIQSEFIDGIDWIDTIQTRKVVVTILH
jgi:hypothetical protein